MYFDKRNRQFAFSSGWRDALSYQLKLNLFLFITLLYTCLNPATCDQAPEFGGINVISSAGHVRVTTIESALDIARKFRGIGERGKIEIILPAGTLRLETPIVLSKEDSGYVGGPLVIRGNPDAPTILSGAVVAATTTADETAIKRLPRPLPLGLVQILVDKVERPTLRSYQTVGRSTLSLYQGHRTLTLARFPEEGFTDDLKVLSDANLKEQVLQFRGADPQLWDDEPYPLVSGYWNYDWAFESSYANIVPGEPGVLSIHLQDGFLSPWRRPRLAVENVFRQMRRPGTYVTDPINNVTLVIPFTGAQDSALEIARADSLLVLRDVAHVVLTDLAFEKTKGNTIEIGGSEQINLENCYIGQSGGMGVIIRGGHSVTMSRCIVTDTAENGVLVSGGDRNNLTPARHVVENSVITKFGGLGRDYKSGVRIEGVGISVTGCRIYGGKASGIIISGNDIEISGNEIFDILYDSDDAGAVYMGRDWSQRGVVVRGNYIHDIGYKRKKKFLVGIYLDDTFSGAMLMNNVIDKVPIGIVIGGGQENVIEGNLIMDPENAAIFFDRRGTKFDFYANLNAIKEKLKILPLSTPPWSMRYPQLLELRKFSYFDAVGNMITRTLTVNGMLFSVRGIVPTEGVFNNVQLALDEKRLRIVRSCLQSRDHCTDLDTVIAEKVSEFTVSNSLKKNKLRFSDFFASGRP